MSVPLSPSWLPRLQIAAAAAEDARAACEHEGVPAAAPSFIRALRDAASALIVEAYERANRVLQPPGTLHRAVPAPRRLPDAAALSRQVRDALLDWVCRPVAGPLEASDETGEDAIRYMQQDVRAVVSDQKRKALATQAALLAEVERAIWQRLVQDCAGACADALRDVGLAPALALTAA